MINNPFLDHRFFPVRAGDQLNLTAHTAHTLAFAGQQTCDTIM